MISEALMERAIERFPVLASLSASDRGAVASAGARVARETGELLFDVGDGCDGFGFLIEGRIKVAATSPVGRELVLYRVHPGETCTVTAACLLSGSPYPARGEVEHAALAVAIPHQLFRALFDASGSFRSFVTATFTSRIQHLMETVSEIAFNKLDLRLASRLLSFGDPIQMTHQQLADEIGSSREMVSRILESFADQGLVQLGRKRIDLLDEKGLRELLRIR